MIKVIVLGKLKENYLVSLVSDYLKRIRKYTKIELIELKDLNDLKKEALEIKKHLTNKEYIITLEIEGKKLNSLELAKLIDKTFINYDTLTFIVGSSLGLDTSIKELSNLSLSFSDLTFPHGLFRALLLEQIYRSYKINNNEEYHK